MNLARLREIARYNAWRFGRWALGEVALLLIRPLRWTDPDGLATFFSWCAQKIGPHLREHRIARDNIANAFPEKSADEVDAILRESWANLGYIGAEFIHLDRLWSLDLENPERGRIEASPDVVERFLAIRDDNKPALVFTAHIGNWELPALAPTALGLDSTVLYRPPNIATFDRIIRDIRSTNMGTMIATGLDAPVRIAEALGRGSHVGMLVDQYLGRGVEITFFGRKTRANPLLARLARQIECPIHGVRIIRLPNHRFRIDLTEEVKPVRDATGAIDIQATTQAINAVIEGWIREYPGQWLWQHRRWR